MTVFRLLAVIFSFLALGAPPVAQAQMGGGMREMMQRMMGDRLPPGIDPKLLPDPTSRGAQLVLQYCAQCHHLPGPGMHTATEWPVVVQRMETRMRMMSGGMMNVQAPGAEALETLTAYLRQYAQRPLTTRFPDSGSPAGEAFHATCGQCHALPDPVQHVAGDWPGVVARMQRNMVVMGKPVPDSVTIEAIVGFLQGHAKTP